MQEQATTGTQDETLNESVPQTETVTTPSEASETLADETTEQSSDDMQALQARIKRMDAALKKANSEAKSHRLKAEDLEKYKEQSESAKLSEQERQEATRQKLEKQLADSEEQYKTAVRDAQQYRVNTEVRLQAAQLGFSDPGDATKFLDTGEIELDDKGNPTNIDDLLKDLAKSKPYLVTRRIVTSGGATNPPRSSHSSDNASELVNRMIAGTLKNDEYNALSPTMKSQFHEEMTRRRTSR